jgi:hypothetical protein
MKNYILLILVVLVLGLAAYFSMNRKGSTLHKRDIHFAVEVPDAITKILIESKNARTDLEKINNQWHVNGEEGNQERIHDLLIISELIEADAPVSFSQTDSINQQLKNGTRISFYEGKRRIYSFLLCKWENMLFARNIRSEKPFRVSVKGYPNIDLVRVFSASATDWTSNILIDLTPDAIEQVKIDYPSKQSRSFHLIVAENGKYTLFGPDSTNLSLKVDHEIAKEYCSFFSKIRFTHLPDSVKVDIAVIRNQKPLFILNIKSSGNKPIRLEGYQKVDSLTHVADSYRFYTIDPDRGLILLNFSDFDPILVSPEYFLKK